MMRNTVLNSISWAAGTPVRPESLRMLCFFAFASARASVQDRPMLVNRLVPPPTVRVAASTRNWLAGIHWIVLTLVIGVFCAERLNAHFGWWWSEVQVRTDTVSLPGAGTWLLPSSRPVPWRQVSPLQVRLVSASGTPLLFTPRTDRVTEFPKLLFSCDKKGNVLLDPRWQLDPFFRAGTVKLVFPTVLPQALSISGWLLLLGVIVLLSRAQGFRADAGSWPRLRALTHRLAESVGRRPAVFLCLPSIYFLVVYPPLWKDVDALCQLVYGVSVTNIFHFPALFCTLARLPLWLGTAIERPGAFAPFTQQEPSLLGIYTLVLCQHALLITSLRAFVVTSCATFFWRGAGVAIILLAPSLYAQVHLCGSESWSLIATIFLFASGLRILQKRPPVVARVGGLCARPGVRDRFTAHQRALGGLACVRVSGLCRDLLPEPSGCGSLVGPGRGGGEHPDFGDILQSGTRQRPWPALWD
jgi:hypothetical protein